MSPRTNKLFIIMFMGIKEAFEYRLELVLWSIHDSLPLMAMVVVWLVLLSNNRQVAGFHQNDIINYYLVGYFFNAATGSYFEDNVINQIKNGHFSFYLLQPISTRARFVVSEVGWRIFNTIFNAIPILLGVFIFYPSFFHQLHPTSWLFIPGTIVGAFLINSFTSLLIVAAGFVFEEAQGLIHLNWMLSWLFSGSLIPFAFMPSWLQTLARNLPFQYSFAYPTQLVLGQISASEALHGFSLLLLWLCVMYLMVDRIWKSNLKKFTAVGN